MIISLTLNGEIYSVEPEQIYQGANNVNEIFIFAPLSANTSFEMEFTLPNGEITKPYVLERIAPVSSQLNTWKLVVDAPLTQYYGVVKYQFKGTINGTTTATGHGSFTITQGVDWTLPETPDTNTYELILNKIAQIEGEVINANSNSEIALENSQKALTTSQEAKTTSEQALSGVQNAVNLGNEAIALARGVDGKAETAIANSQQANENALEAIERAEEAKAIASEKANSKVFDTYSEMVAWLRNADNKGKLAVGSTLYIKDENVPDYWVTAVYEETDTLGFYYGFEELESKLPDISNMVTTDTEQNITGAKNFTSIKKNGYDLQGKLTGIDFVSTDNMTTYADGKATIHGEFTTTTETDQTANVISGSIEFGIKGSDTIVVEEDKEGSAIEIHLDKAVEDKITELESGLAGKVDQSGLDGVQQQLQQAIDQTNIDINEVRNIANENTETLKVKADAIDLSNLEAKALKTPLSAPSEVKLVAINTNNAQTLVDVPKGAILYNTTGQNTDGAMSQKAVTDTFVKKTDIPEDIMDLSTTQIVTGAKEFDTISVNKIYDGSFDVYSSTTTQQIFGSGKNTTILGQTVTLDTEERPKWYNLVKNETKDLATTDDIPIKTITDTSVRIWDLASGTYVLPNNCKIYYNGATNTANYYNAQGDRTILDVNTSKAGTEKFFRFEYTTGSNAYYQYYIFTGMTTASNGYVKGVDLNARYPTGAVYISTNTTSPASLFGGSWEELGTDKALWLTSTSSANAGTTISAGLPNITGSWYARGVESGHGTASGAFSFSADGGNYGTGHTSGARGGFSFNAGNSNSIYGSSTTVQPPAYRVYAWRRIS